MKVIDGLITRQIAGEYILIPTGSAALKIHGMISLSESGYLLFERLRSSCTEEELVDVIMAEYDVEREIALKDVNSFVERMREIGLLQEIKDGRNE